MLRNKETGEIFNRKVNGEGYYFDLFSQKMYKAEHNYYDGLSLDEVTHLEVFFGETLEEIIEKVKV